VRDHLPCDIYGGQDEQVVNVVHSL
jgi:hypothetical protein